MSRYHSILNQFHRSNEKFPFILTWQQSLIFLESLKSYVFFCVWWPFFYWNMSNESLVVPKLTKDTCIKYDQWRRNFVFLAKHKKCIKILETDIRPAEMKEEDWENAIPSSAHVFFSQFRCRRTIWLTAKRLKQGLNV